MRINSYASTGQAIQAPFTFYYVRDNDWSDSHSYQFWNKNFTAAASVNNTATLKTIYSPSPSGFVEPKTAAFTGFTSSGNNSSNASEFNIAGNFLEGWNFYTNGWKSGSTIFFSAFGFRDTYSGRTTGTGALAYVKEGGGYWSAGAYSALLGRYLDFYSGLVYPQNTLRRSSGFTVRPVTE